MNLTYRKLHIPLFFLLAFVLVGMPFYGCKKEEGTVVAIVNDIPIDVEEFKKECAIIGKREPTFKMTEESCLDNLDMLIERKLLIQEAVKSGIEKDEKFAEAMKRFREQTLIKELIKKKNAEFERRFSITDFDVEAEYKKILLGMPVLKVAFASGVPEAEEIKKKMLKKESVTGEVIVGPLAYGEVDNVYLPTFGMKRGEVLISELDKGYIVMILMRREKEPIEIPSEELKEKIKNTLFEEKNEKAFKEWIKGIKTSSNIEINKELLTESCK